MDDFDLDQDVEDETETTEPTEQPQAVVDWQREAEKARKEAHGLRQRLRRTEVAAKHGVDPEAIPGYVPLKELDGFVETFMRRQASADAQTQDETPESPAEETNPDAPKLAAVMSGGQSGAPTTQQMSAREWMQLRQSNPGEADRVLRSGGVASG